ncbi:hypothetical protein FHS74_001031 [Nitrospirillum iridis]|uniref:Uncharacterized protein n=1 Tax=Nitrospirillum iridis TaxID=765888 RepID=A0A7X0AUU1_9PROT|nr:hypothetical protein [Nitrospirillum iridis]
MKRSKDIGQMAQSGGTPSPCERLCERLGSVTR